MLLNQESISAEKKAQVRLFLSMATRGQVYHETLKALSTSLLGSEQQEAQNFLGFRQRASVTAHREHFVPLGPYNSRCSYFPYSVNGGLMTGGFPVKVITKSTTKLILFFIPCPLNPRLQKVVTLRWIIPSHCLGTWEVRMLPVSPAKCILRSSFPSSPSRCPRTSSNNYVNNASRVPKS